MGSDRLSPRSPPDAPFVFRAISLFRAGFPRGNPGKPALFRSESAGKPRARHETAPSGAVSCTLHRPLGTTRDPAFLRSLGTRTPGGRGASVRPPLEPPSRPDRRLVHRVRWYGSPDGSGRWGVGQGIRKRVGDKDTRGKVGVRLLAEPRPPGAGSDTPRPTGLRDVPLDPVLPGRVLAPTLPREGPRGPPGALVSSPFVKDRTSPVRPACGTGG
jgi:hypothetical protein